MPFERYEILLPLNYNDGTPLEPEKFQETRRELVEQFGALTMDAPTIAGLWTSSGPEYRDELLRFVVDTEACCSFSPAIPQLCMGSTALANP